MNTLRLVSRDDGWYVTGFPGGAECGPYPTPREALDEAELTRHALANADVARQAAWGEDDDEG